MRAVLTAVLATLTMLATVASSASAAPSQRPCPAGRPTLWSRRASCAPGPPRTGCVWVRTSSRPAAPSARTPTSGGSATPRADSTPVSSRIRAARPRRAAPARRVRACDVLTAGRVHRRPRRIPYGNVHAWRATWSASGGRSPRPGPSSGAYGCRLTASSPSCSSRGAPWPPTDTAMEATPRSALAAR